MFATKPLQSLAQTSRRDPTMSDESRALSRELRSRGFAFVGPTTMYALTEAVGIVDTNLVGSRRRGTSGLWSTTGHRRPMGQPEEGPA